MPNNGRVKVKKINSKGSDADASILNDMFEQMTGSKNAEPEILIPKITELHILLKKFIKVYKLLLNFNEFIDKFQEFDKEFTDIKLFITNIEHVIDEHQILMKDGLQSLPAETINNIYKTLKDTQELQSIIVTSCNLSKHKRYLEDKTNLNDDFIKREPGLSLTPLKFTKLDLKLLWVSDKLTNMAKKYILNILNHTYTIGHEMYEIITSPDIDIKKFSKILIDNIEKMKKTIPRCDKAFNIIKNSVELLENNFKGYYKNSVEAENPSIIVESFIIDVSMSQKANASITGQFRRIIMFMKKQAANNSDPRVKKLFKILNTQFDLMAQKTGVVDPSEETTPDEKVEETTKDEKVEEENEEDEMPELVDILNNIDGSEVDNPENMQDMLTGLMSHMTSELGSLNDDHAPSKPKEDSIPDKNESSDEIEIVD